MYATAPDVRMLYAARALVGLGSASTSVARAHVTKAVPQCRRTHHLAYLSGLQFIGFAVLPAFGGMFANMPSSELRFGDMMQEANARSALTVLLNGFTYPAWVLVFANVLGAVLVALFYASPGKPCRSDVLSPLTSPSSARYGQTIPLCEEELHTEGREDRVLTSPVCSGRARRTKHGTFETMPESSTTPATKPDWVALTICLLINLVFRGVLAQLETVSIPFMTEQFGMDYGTASIWMSMIGAVGVCIYFSFKPVSGTFSDKTLVFMGLTFIALGCFPLSIPAFSKELSLSSYIMLLSFTWSVAYPVGQTATLALFSKVLGGYNVGSFMGLFSASGALSPLLLSALATKLWEFYGRESVFAFILVTVFVAGVLLSLTYRRLTAARLPF